jgi:hypothetical protein
MSLSDDIRAQETRRVEAAAEALRAELGRGGKGLVASEGDRRASVEPLWIHSEKLETEIAARSAETVRLRRAGNRTDVSLGDVPRLTSLRHPDQVATVSASARRREISVKLCVIYRRHRDRTEDGSCRRMWEARLRQHQLTLAIMLIDREMRACQRLDLFDRGEGEPVAPRKIEFSRRMRGLSAKLNRARAEADHIASERRADANAAFAAVGRMTA